MHTLLVSVVSWYSRIDEAPFTSWVRFFQIVSSILATRLKMITCSRLLKTGRMQQCCAAHIVHSCQQYCSALLSLNQPAIKCNNAEQYC